MRYVGITPRDRGVRGAKGAVFSATKCEPALRRTICRPFRVNSWVVFVLGLKTQPESFYRFLLRYPGYGGQVGRNPTPSYGTIPVGSYVAAQRWRMLVDTLAPSLFRAVIWLSCFSEGGVTQAAEHRTVASDYLLDIRVQASAFGNARPDDIAVVLRSAGSELLRYCPDTQLEGIDVYYRADHPEIDAKRTPSGRIAMALSARDTHWAQYGFQFAHEFCHALANYANSFQQTIPDRPNSNLWLEESLCETASLFSLRAMSRTWQVSPPSPALRTYAPWLADYANQRLALPEHRLPVGTPFSDWFRQHQPALRKDAGHRNWNAIIAAQILPIFEAQPAGWEAVIFLNRGSTNRQESLSEHFAQWRANCPDRLRPFVSKLAGVFGVNL